MTTRTSIRTPLGEFATLAQAASAHKCDRHTITARILAQPQHYQKITRTYESKQTFVVRGVRWPIAWHQYRLQDEDVKDAIYQAWCKANSLDPEGDGTADRFFDDMDQQPQVETNELTENLE